MIAIKEVYNGNSSSLCFNLVVLLYFVQPASETLVTILMVDDTLI